MFERFTDQAIKVIMLAQEEARRLGHNFVGAEFIFLGLIGEATGIASQVLRQQGITLKNARIEVEKILGRGSGISPEMSPVDIPFTESAKLVLNNAVSIARQLEHESINTEHLLIGIIQEGESTARILQNLQVNPQDLAISLSQYFQQQSSNQLPQNVYVLLYNVGTDNEGIHTISVDDNHKILLFESQEDAATFARQLGEQNFPVPSVEAMKAEEILLFCKKSVYDWEFVPKGANRTPPVDNKDIDQEDTAQQKRTQAYLNLINQLLTCNQGDEPRILQENQELLDQGLIEVMLSVSREYGNAGRENEAKRLINIAQQLAQALGLLDNTTTESANTSQDYFNFLGEALRKVADDINPPQLIHSFLEENLDKLDENLILVLNDWAKKNLPLIDNTEEAYSILSVIVDLSHSLMLFTLGDKKINLEIAITGYQIALNTYSFEVCPEDWAKTQRSIGFAYSERIKGDKLENLEKAITAYTESLKFYTSQDFPQDWALIQKTIATLCLQWANIKTSLANAYSERIKGNKAENLEMTVKHYTEASSVITFQAFPQEWAKLQLNIAMAYLQRIRGDKAENLEIAISYCQKVLKAKIFNYLSKEWADIQLILRSAYFQRIRGDKAENLEIAIIHCREALKVFTFQAFPKQWAMEQNNLANAYYNRIQGNKAENLETAIAYYQEALKVFTFQAFPEQWADGQIFIGSAYSERIKGNKAENLETAITYYQEALKVFTFQAFPKQWAGVKNDLSMAYRKRIRGNQAENLEMAITYCQEALKVFTFQAFPEEWADTQSKLANAYSERIRGNQSENLELAIVHNQERLKVFTFQASPKQWAITQNNREHLTFAISRNA
jgi:tetratricopeptide (TPR) repeat protein